MKKIAASLDFFKLGLFLLALLVPPFLTPNSIYIYFWQILVAAGFFLGVLQASVAGYSFLRIERRYFLAPLGFFLCFILYTFYQSLTAYEFGKALPSSAQIYTSRQASFSLCFYALFFLLAVDCLSTRRRMRLAVFLLGIQLTALILIGFFINTPYGAALKKIYRFTSMAGYPSFSTFFSASHYSFYVALLFGFFFSEIFYWIKRKAEAPRLDSYVWGSLFYMVLLAGGTISIFFARGRTGVLLALFFLLIFLFLVFAHKKSWKLYPVLIVSGAAFAGVSALSLKFDLSKFSRVGSDFSIRIQKSKDALALFMDHPLFGSGLGTYQFLSQKHQTYKNELYYFLHATNDHIELLTDTGIFGYFIVVLATLFFLGKVCPKVRSSPSDWCRSAGIFSLAAVILYYFCAGMDFYSATPAIFTVFIFYGAYLIKAETLYSPPDGTTPNPLFQMLFLTGALAVAGALGFHSWSEYDKVQQVNSVLKSKIVLSKDPQGRRIMKFVPPDPKTLQLLMTSHPHEFELLRGLGRAYYEKYKNRGGDKEDLEKAIHCFEMAVAAAPTFPESYRAASRIYMSEKMYDQGIAMLEQAVLNAPNNRNLYLDLISACLEVAKKTSWEEKAEEYREKAFYWTRRAAEGPRPLTPQNCQYENFDNHHLPKDIRTQILKFLNQLKSETADGAAQEPLT